MRSDRGRIPWEHRERERRGAHRQRAGGRRLSVRAQLLIVGAVVLVLFVWRSGALDQPLSSLGLNAHPCIRNGYGATFCGSEASAYCASMRWAPDACADLDPSAAMNQATRELNRQTQAANSFTP